MSLQRLLKIHECDIINSSLYLSSSKWCIIIYLGLMHIFSKPFMVNVYLRDLLNELWTLACTVVIYCHGVMFAGFRPETEVGADVRACVLSVGVLPGAMRCRRGAGRCACALWPDAHQQVRARALRLRQLFRGRGGRAGPTLLRTPVL